MEFINENKLDLALNTFEKAIEMDSTGLNGIAHNEIGYVYLKKLDSANALSWFNKSIEINPKNPKPRQNKALTYLTFNDLDNAIKTLDKFVNEIPNWPTAYFQRGNIYEHLGRDEEAFRDYKTALYYNQELNVLPKEIVEKIEDFKIKN